MQRRIFVPLVGFEYLKRLNSEKLFGSAHTTSAVGNAFARP